MYWRDYGEMEEHCWHIGEPVPAMAGKIMIFQADGDELDLILRAMAGKQVVKVEMKKAIEGAILAIEATRKDPHHYVDPLIALELRDNLVRVLKELDTPLDKTVGSGGR